MRFLKQFSVATLALKVFKARVIIDILFYYGPGGGGGGGGGVGPPLS